MVFTDPPTLLADAVSLAFVLAIGVGEQPTIPEAHRAVNTAAVSVRVQFFGTAVALGAIPWY